METTQTSGAVAGPLSENTADAADARRYRWLKTYAVNEIGRDADGEEYTRTPWLHFDDVNEGESLDGAIDRHIATGSTDAVS